jgi:hypothetical protein
LSIVFSFISRVDLALAAFLSLGFRLCIWGLVAGGAAMAIYVLASHQQAIANLKSEIKELQNRLWSAAEIHSDYAALAAKNIKASLKLLAIVVLPALLSAVPVLVIAGWVDAHHSYTLPPPAGTVPLTFVPNLTGLVKISPPELVRREPGALKITWPRSHHARITFTANGQALYSGELFETPVPVIAKKNWLNIVFPSLAGYVNPSSPIDEIHLELPRKRIFYEVPLWASGWEFPYFLGVCVAGLALKLALKIQ